MKKPNFLFKYFAVLFLLFLQWQTVAAAEPVSVSTGQRKVQIALLLDTSNSMDGLIDQAKSQLWNIVNKLSALRHRGRDVTFEIALYEYGNVNLPAQEGFLRMVVPFTTDLDKISAALFALKTNGGDEFCGEVIGSSVKSLTWSTSPQDLKLIFIAGNEPFDQGRVPFTEEVLKAKAQNIRVNTIYCGDYQTGLKTRWKEGAVLGLGDYFNIDSNAKTVYIETPFDTELEKLNNDLNKTYIAYTQSGLNNQEQQVAQDSNARRISKSNLAGRTSAKISSVYQNESWDLVDAYKKDSTILGKLKKDELPGELKGKNAAELDQMVKTKTAEREAIAKQINTLNQKRLAYIAEKQKSLNVVNPLENSIYQALEKQAKALGFEFKSGL